jgi:hydrophobe/amphiphile efflux-3 (HAE3) family protein
MQQFARRLVHSHPWWIIGVVAALTVVFAYEATQINITTDLTNFFSEDDPRVMLFNETTEAFGSTRFVMIALEAEQVFSVSGIQALNELTQSLAEVEGVERVCSLVNSQDVRGSELGIEINPMLTDLPTNEEEVAAFRRKVDENKHIAGRLVSEDGRFALILASVEEEATNDVVIRDIRRVVESTNGEFKAFLTGQPVLAEVMNKALRDDLLRLSPLVVLLILLILYASFRNWQGVLLPLLTVLVSTVWTLGLMGWLRVPLTQMSAILPAVFTSVGSAYGIHFLHRYRGERIKNAHNGPLVQQTMAAVGPAIFMAGATTAAGFLSNAFGSIVRIREFGIFTAFGVMVAILVSLLVIPAILTILDKRHPGNWQSSGQRGESAVLAKLGKLVWQRQGVVVVLAAAMVIAALLGLPRLVTDTNFVNFFDRRSPARQAFHLVQEHFGGVESVQIVVKGDITDPTVLQGMQRAQERLQEVPNLAKPISVVDVITQVSRVLHADDPAYERIPDSSAAVAQYLLLLSLSGDQELEQLITFDNEQAKIEALMADCTSQERKQILAQVEDIAAELGQVPGVDDVDVTGLPFLAQAMSDLITEGQIQSLAFSLIAVFLLVWPIVGSPLGSLLCLIPIIITVITNFGVMAWAGISVNVVTALVTGVAVGMGVDYSIHMYTRCREELERCHSLPQALQVTTATTGYAVLLNAISVSSGFLMLLFSAFQPLRVFGALITATMVVSSLSAITVLPALLAMVHKLGRSGRLAKIAHIYSAGDD